MLLQGFHGLRILHLYNALIKTVRTRVKNPDVDLIKRAFTFASRAHENQKRLSGEPYIIHPLAVAQILAELSLDTPTIVAAILHDVVEDTEHGEETIIREFGNEINTLVKSVTKISMVKKESTGHSDENYNRLKEMEAAENIRLMLLATARDVRVILIKLADKMHNMRTLQFQKPHKIKRIATEVMKIYAPIAGRLGMFRMKSELEDLAFAHLEPERYNQIQQDLKLSRAELEDFIHKIRKILKQRLVEINIDADVKGRAKHIYSIYNKMSSQDKGLKDIYDLRGVRVIVDEIRDCYGTLGIVHTLWTPIPGRFKDYIATPKINGYQSLHTTVMGPDARPLEVQIRTREMDETADHGIAAHWIYKASGEGHGEKFRSKWLSRLTSIVESSEDANTFIEDLSHELSPEEVYVFTPRGDILDLPVGATVLDFAFRIHTDIGLRCRGARVNDRMVPLRTELKSGDRVEVITEKNPNPSPNWLRYLKSQRARQKLRSYFRQEEDLEIQPEESPKEDSGRFSGLFKSKQKKKDQEIPEKKTDHSADTEELRISRKKTDDPKRVEVAGARDIQVRYAQCCSPVPGDEIVGFVTRGRGITVHRKDCTMIPTDGERERLIPVKWEGLTEKYPVKIEITANDRQGLYMELVSDITRTYTNILRAEADIPKNGKNVMFARFLLEVEHLDHLKEIIESLLHINGVQSVERVQMTDDEIV